MWLICKCATLVKVVMDRCVEVIFGESDSLIWDMILEKCNVNRTEETFASLSNCESKWIISLIMKSWWNSSNIYQMTTHSICPMFVKYRDDGL